MGRASFVVTVIARWNLAMATLLWMWKDILRQFLLLVTELAIETHFDSRTINSEAGFEYQIFQV